VTAELKDQKNVLKGLEEGAIDYLYKPLNPEITEAKVSVLLQLQRQRKELVEKNMELEKAQQEIRQLYADLERKNAQLELTNKELESFSYSVSHDLRAPLRSINGYAQIIREEYAGSLGDEARRLFQIIQNNAKKMGTLIDDLLAFARMGRKELTRLPVDMKKLVEPIVADIVNNTGSKAQVTIHPLLPVYGDPVLLSQVYINLVSNAIKYSAKTENPAVEIGSYEEENDHVYYVKDNGAGFDMTYVHKLFGVFQRLHTHEEFEGTGVGLAIVQRIIVKHGGKVWAEGKMNEGASFYFSLPKPVNL
jgi:light-regulated signal transduction histidine kinase (bacteriophytochrome)